MAAIEVQPYRNDPEYILDSAYVSAYGQFRSLLTDNNNKIGISGAGIPTLNRQIVKPIKVYLYSEEHREKSYYHRRRQHIIAAKQKIN